jgi:hypothetical protein
MPESVGAGPQHPGRIIVVTTAIVAAVVGLVTGQVAAFMLALIGCAVALCAGYALLRRLLGWKPLTIDDVFHLIGILHP